MAFPRSAGSVKTFVMMESVEGMMHAPPTPIRARVAMSASAEVTMAEAADPTPKMSRPMARSR